MPRPPAQKKPINVWFVLGRETKLAAAEAVSFLNAKDYELTRSTLIAPYLKFPLILPPPQRGPALWRREDEQGVRFRDADSEDDMQTIAENLIQSLGGTVKIGEEISHDDTIEGLKKIIFEKLKKEEGKITFGISYYGNNWPRSVKNLGLEIKKELRRRGYSARYIFKNEPALSSVTVKVNNLIGKGGEFLIISRGNNHFSLARTLAVQPFEKFGERDYGRPGRDDLSGMLPPKLAMMMVNLSQCPKNGLLLDPFCGSGTILTEAMLLEYANLIGSDISKKAIEDTKKNIEWTKKISNIQYPPQRFTIGTISNITLFQSDIRQINQNIKPGTVDAIVTEPYLGKPLRGGETRDKLTRQAKELKKLYIEAFKQFGLLLKPNGVVVIIIPKFRRNNEWIAINIADETKKLGLTPVPLFENQLSLTYARPYQRVEREIWKLVKN